VERDIESNLRNDVNDSLTLAVKKLFNKTSVENEALPTVSDAAMLSLITQIFEKLAN
jgi:hypothetical protein